MKIKNTRLKVKNSQTIDLEKCLEYELPLEHFIRKDW